MTTMDMREIIKAIERLREYTYSSVDDTNATAARKFIR